MAKQRNSLGVLVLTAPLEQMTWQEYKKKYGINLDEIFEYIPSEQHAYCKFSFTKILAINWLEVVKGLGYKGTHEPVITIAYGAEYGGDSLENAIFYDGAGQAYRLLIDTINKTIQGGEA